MNKKNKDIPPLLGALLVAITPHFTTIPLWVILWCLALWVWVFILDTTDRPFPKPFVRFALTVLGIGVVVFTSIRFGGRQYISLLAILAGLKPLEIKSQRDKMITVFIAYFLVIAGLFQSESLAMTLYMFFSVLVSTAVLIQINHPTGRFKNNLKLSARIMLQALPLMIALFFLFPRIEGSLWGARTAISGTTGFQNG
jgi:hypothetical protein